jgi:rod shape-determining protein MreD
VTAFLAVLFLGLAMTMIQGAIPFVISPPWCPDLCMLVVIAVGLYWRRWYSGLLLAMALGFFADVLSGSLLGTHALVSLVIFVVAWLSSRQLNLRSPLALSIFAAIVSLFDVFATLALTGFFVSVSLPVGALWADGWIHAAVNALFAVPVVALVAAVISRVDGETGSRQALLLERGGGLT